MFNLKYLRATLVAGAFGAAVEASWQLARNAPYLRAPVGLTVAADALAAGAFTAALFWFYAAVLRRVRRRRPESVPTAAAYAAVLAPLLWYAAFAALPPARLAWLAALGIGAVAAPFAGALLAAAFRRRGVAAAVAAVAAVTLLAFTALRFLERTRPFEPTRANFILVTLDTTRADRIGCYGCADARTPTLDNLAARGVKFDQALCLEPITAPSHATMMTSLYPETTGVVLNGMRLRGDVPTLSEQFRSAGYATVAFVAASSVQARDTALDRGFELYDDDVSPREGYRASPLMPRALAEKLALLAKDDNLAERPADEVTDAALRWLKRHRRRPFFMWLHYFDPHDDYEPPPEFSPPRLGSRPIQKIVNENWADGKGGPHLPERIAALYGGEIAFMDSQLGRFFDALARAGLAERTVVLVVGDHGEAFGEHGTKYHGFHLYREELEVPFIVCDLGGELPDVPEPSRRATTLDVAPTLLDLAGLPIPDRMRGESLFRPLAAPPPAYCICVPDPLRQSKQSLGRLEALVTPAEKLIARADGVAEYYDLTVDPAEETDLAESAPDRVAELRAALDEFRASVDAPPAGARDLDGESAAKLRALGYIK
ncbi:MAG TPA: sulfatase [bacterium]|nr:sulfatase [bacterium]